MEDPRDRFIPKSEKRRARRQKRFLVAVLVAAGVAITIAAFSPVAAYIMGAR